MSVSLLAERDRIQRQVAELEQSLSATHADLELLSSETDDESGGDDTEEEAGQAAAGLLAEREKIQREIQSLENVLGPHSPICVSDDDSSSSEESELGLSLSVDSCLQMNLVYQQVVQETLDQLEMLLTHNHRQQKEVVSQLSGPNQTKESRREQRPPSSCQQPVNMFLGRFLKPYFKDNLTGLGPPANQETKEKASRMTGCLDDKKLKKKRWESWQKTLLIHSVSRDGLRRLIQPKLSKVDYLTQKLSSASETDRQQFREQIDSLEREIDLLRGKKEEELVGDRYDEHDWQKISNIDFEGTRDAEDIRCFWQNFLHPSINKSRWSQEEVQQLKEVSRRHGETHWEDIAAELGTGRTAFLCLQTFQRFVSGSLRRTVWTPAEDAQLRELVDKMRIGNFIPYTQMSYFMEGRDPAQLIYRWNQVLDPSLKKGMWTQQEDQLLLQAVSRHGEKDWCKIRFEVPGRTDSACRDRYYDSLKAGTKRGAFDKQERELLLQLVEKHGVGRWAKIAAEIPHRIDAQCLREWRKLSRVSQPRAQKRTKTKQPPTQPEGAQKEKKAAPTRRRRRRRQLIKLEEEEEEEEEEAREEEETVVQYMDSDEEENKNTDDVPEVVNTEEEEKEEEKEVKEEEYTFPPLQEWAPAEKAPCFTSLIFQPVELPSCGDARRAGGVRSTVVGPHGRSVVIGPPPRVHRGHGAAAMMMVSADQLRSHLHRRAQKVAAPRSGLTEAELSCELQAAVTPWIGYLLIPDQLRRTTADSLRERGERSGLASTSVFLLLLQTLSVDSVGCKQMIKGRISGTRGGAWGGALAAWAAPPPDPSSARRRNPNTVAGMLQQKQEREQNQNLKLNLNQPRPPPTPPRTLPILLHVRPNTPPQPVSPLAASLQLVTTPPPAPQRPPPPAVISSAPPLRQEVPPPSVNSSNQLRDHDYALIDLGPAPNKPPKAPPRRRKRGRGEEQQDDPPVGETGEAGGETGTGVTQTGKRIRKPSQRLRALQEAKAEAKKKRPPPSSPMKRSRAPRSKQEVVCDVLTQQCLRPAQPMFVMTPARLAPPPGLQLAPPPGLQLAPPSGLQLAPPPGLQLAPPSGLQLAPPPGLQLALVPAPPVGHQTTTPSPRPSVPIGQPRRILPRPPHAPPPWPPSKLFLPYKGAVRADPATPPPLRRQALEFDPSLMFLEPPTEVCDWLSGQGGVAVPGAGVALPYLPPFVSSLSALSALLRAKSSLTATSLQLLSQGSEPRPPRPPRTKHTPAAQSPHLPDSTSDLRPATDDPAPCVSSDPPQEEAGEAELTAAVRRLVAERFSGNPAYQLLKARFLSCFTLPALLATVQPITTKTEEEEEEEKDKEEEEELKKIKERGKLRRVKRSLMLSDNSGASANQLSGINTDPPTTGRTGSDRTGPLKATDPHVEFTCGL